MTKNSQRRKDIPANELLERNRSAHAESDTNQGSAGHCAIFDALM